MYSTWEQDAVLVDLQERVRHLETVLFWTRVVVGALVIGKAWEAVRALW